MQDGVITDDGRIRAAIPTIKLLQEAGASVLVCSHLGRPDGQQNLKYSLAPAAKALAELLNQEVFFASDTVGSDARGVAKALVPGGVAVLENLRFSEAETSKDDSVRASFAEKLAALADVFVSDGFGVVHRKQASVYELAQQLPSAAGLLIEREVEVLKQLTSSDQRPYTVVLGGSKVSDKIGVIGSLLPKIDNLIIGGGMLFTFLAAKGHKVASSLLEPDQIPVVEKYLSKLPTLGSTSSCQQTSGWQASLPTTPKLRLHPQKRWSRLASGLQVLDWTSAQTLRCVLPRLLPNPRFVSGMARWVFSNSRLLPVAPELLLEL